MSMFERRPVAAGVRPPCHAGVGSAWEPCRLRVTARDSDGRLESGTTSLSDAAMETVVRCRLNRGGRQQSRQTGEPSAGRSKA